ncbi:GFA family protein [Phenylobacterium sp.]|uniref:GFA family protein n=1 Tax=Phenylobacterium sp. TaxID=1871053 RepID=UPI002CD40413|nr:GFA family protein [Phenylobacterium sp.]HLZ74475.1 GFA family protein [Phenylobacterium sp.]
MTQRTASCSCGALSIATEGEPIKVSACHCVSCQKRTGSAFSVAVFFDEAQTTPAGTASQYVRLGDSGQPVEFNFCPTCASTVFWRPAFRPGWIGVAIGCFDDRGLRPTQAVYEHERLDWAAISIEGRA